MEHIHAVDVKKLNNYWLDYEGNRVTLQNMIEGYTNHLNLHLGQIHELISSDDQAPFAHVFYKKIGFEDTDVEQLTNGIRYFPMKRTI